MRAHDSGLIRQQYILFALADMMTHVEVGAGLARKAVRLSRAGDPGSEKSGSCPEFSRKKPDGWSARTPRGFWSDVR